MAKRDVFISYKSEDFETACWVRSVLETNGISCWMAPRDIPGGSNYAAEIPAAITGARIFVVVLSSKTQESTWVPKEIDLAMNRGKVIMPFMTERFQLRDDFNFYLSNVQRYAAYEDKANAIGKMVKEIKAILGVETGGQETAAAPEIPGSGGSAGKRTGGKPAGSTETAGKKAAVKAAGRKRTIIAVCCALVLLAGIAAGVTAFTGKKPDSSGREPARQAAAPGQADESTELHIMLYPSENVSVRDFSKAKDILRERLDVFTDGAAYQWIDNGDGQIDLFLPEKAFAGYFPEKILRCYLSRAIDLYAINISNTKQRIKVERSDLAGVELKTGAVPGFDAGTIGISGDQYQYIVITLTDEYAAKHREEYAAWEQFAFAQDCEKAENEYYYYHTVPGEDGKTFYIINDDLGGKFSELLAFNLQHESLPESFLFLVDLNAGVAWEDPGQAANRGANQRTPGELGEKATVTFAFTVRRATTGQIVDTMTAIKRRMDTLGSPYAIGTYAAGQDDARIAVRTTLEHMGPHIIGLVGYHNTNQQVRTRSCLTELFSSLYTVEGRPGESFAYEIKPSYDSRKEEIAVMAKTAEKRGETVCLWMDDMPELVIDRQEAAASGRMLVSGLCRMDNARIETVPVDEQNAWYANLVTECLNTAGMMYSSINDTYLQMNKGQDGKLPGDADFGVQDTHDISRIAKAVKDIDPAAETYFGKGYIAIQLHLPLDGSFPEAALDELQQLYKKLQELREDSLGIRFWLTDLDSTANEYATVRFNREYGRLTTDADGTKRFGESHDTLFAMIGNGRLTQYTARIRELAGESEFWQGFNRYEDATWFLN